MEKEIIEKIIDALCDRCGFDDWWGNVDTYIKNEIKEELESIIKSKNIKMKIKNLREWLDTLPQELDEHDLVFRKIIPGDDESWLAHDKPITACGIDEGSNEAYFCDEASHEVMKNS